MAACPFIQSKCSATQTNVVPVKDSTGKITSKTTTINIAAAWSGQHACTYKIHATEGAPGFKVTGAVVAGTVKVSWIDYDLNKINVENAYGTWPLKTAISFDVTCGSNCIGGMLLPRTKLNTTSNRLYDLNAYEILKDLNAVRK